MLGKVGALWVENTVQIERRRWYSSLTQHYVNLPAMMGLVIEKMADRNRRIFNVLFALAACIAKWSAKEICPQMLKEHLNTCVFLDPGRP